MSVVRLTFVDILQKCVNSHRKTLLQTGQYSYLNFLQRAFATVPLEYNDKDPAPLFFSTNVQKLLRYVTRPVAEKVFRKRNDMTNEKLKTPKYEFMTDHQLQCELAKAEKKANKLLSMPPVVKVFDDSNLEILAVEPALTGHDNSKFIFTDISYGLKNSERIITVREPDGVLHTADHDTRKRCLLAYLPMEGREFLEPQMFTDETLFNDLLNRKEYEFILDRACIQYEPDEAQYQRITNKTYLRIDENKDFNVLRSTRHFGSMTFFLAWNNIIDNLLLEIIQNGYIREAVTLVNLQRSIHPKLVSEDDSKQLADEILKLQRPITDQTQYVETEADMKLDEKCMDCVSRYIQNNSSKKAVQELALQAYQDALRNKMILQNEIKSAHGF